MKGILYTYNIGNKVIIKGEHSVKYTNTAYKRPNSVTAVNNNGTVQIDMGIVSNVYNICNVYPYQRSP
jgi:hypothetical protein